MKYFMGIDRTDNREHKKYKAAVCVMDDIGNIRYFWATDQREEFDKEVERLKRYYGLSKLQVREEK